MYFKWINNKTIPKYFILFTFLINLSCGKIHKKKDNSTAMDSFLNQDVHAFYYAWYANPKKDQNYRHWNHKVMPHWSDSTWNHLPPYSGNGDIGANFYPLLGTYSSNDSILITEHMRMIISAGIGTISLSWWGEGSFEDLNVKLILDAAAKVNLKVNFHLEPIPNRTAYSTVKMIKYIIDNYGNHKAFYKYNDKALFYVYDSYLTSKKEWSQVLNPNTSETIRGTKYDATIIGLWVNKDEESFFLESGFDGFYTYFASNGFTYGASIDNWEYLSKWAKEKNKIFIPCVGPGYKDTRVRPWNSKNSKKREKGLYFDKMFKSAIEKEPNIIGITSFNEWHEGTQIEPAVSKKNDLYRYEDYSPLSPYYYLERTRHWSKIFSTN